ncbi:hypothetical protein B1B04_12755 [Lysinibacillus sp. KCTC 33748]|nr:hypothetical protein B1B04_12755 [Lysinibacillus sp. KCTC 33748]SKB81697.1 hypothetical protein SAMN06295926_1093 [Lysinibacillus sp. AC-3]
MYVEAKLQFHTILDQVFPEYRKVLGDLYSKVSLLMLKKNPTSEDIIEAVHVLKKIKCLKVLVQFV